MATQTLTYATSTTTSFTKLTIPNASSVPRTQSVESIKLIGRNPSPPPSSTKLQRSSSASEMLALVNLANLQRLHIRASEPSSSSGGLDSSSASDDDAGSSSSSSSSDSEECETPDQVSPPYTRPTSPIGYIYDSEAEDEEEEEEEWDLRKIKYTAGAELAPCFARGVTAEPTAESSPRSSFPDSEDEEEDEGGMMMGGNKKSNRSWSPGTPAIEKVEYHWSTASSSSSSTPSSSAVSTPLTSAEEEEDGYFNDDDDDDMIGSELDAGEVWPDEMDSDDFPYLHTWPHSWIWTPSSDSSCVSNPTPNPLPQIHFHYVESQVPDQSSWTPIQDSRFGGMLTVPGHRAYNCVDAPSITLSRRRVTATVVPVQQLCEGAKVEYDEKLGRCAVRVPGLKEQKDMGLYSVPSLSSSSASSSSKKGRRARSRVREMTDEDEDEAYEAFVVEDDEDGARGRGRGRGRTTSRKATINARQFVLSAIREAHDDEEEDEAFVYNGVSGRAGRWD